MDSQKTPWTVAAECAGLRLDHFIVLQDAMYSRAQWTPVIRGGAVQVNGKPCFKASTRVRTGDQIQVAWEAFPTARTLLTPYPLDLNVVYADPDVCVVHKPKGLVVHPGSGNTEGTLVHALLHYDPSLAVLPRAGLVHRLDKDTTGLLLVARNAATLKALLADLAARRIKRIYEALAGGGPMPAQVGVIEGAIQRDPHFRVRMQVAESGRFARTHYRVLHTGSNGISHLELALETGRTHQIRVHLSHIGHPVCGDVTYGGRRTTLHPRVLLHARDLGFWHPTTQEWRVCHAPIPADLKTAVAALLENPGERPH